MGNNSSKGWSKLNALRHHFDQNDIDDLDALLATMAWRYDMHLESSTNFKKFNLKNEFGKCMLSYVKAHRDELYDQIYMSPVSQNKGYIDDTHLKPLYAFQLSQNEKLIFEKLLKKAYPNLQIGEIVNWRYHFKWKNLDKLKVLSCR